MTDHGRPSVLIVGGFATMPPNYLAFRRRLLRAGAARVDICRLWPPDWMVAGLVGFGPILRRTGRAIAATYLAGGRKPILVIGHSAGGIAARLAMSPVPFGGRVADVSEAVGCLVTLGTPHGLYALPNRYQHAGHQAAAFLDRETPGAFFAPRTSYLSIGSKLELAPEDRRPGGRIGDEIFRMIVGDDAALDGDGIVPLAAAHLEGARHITFEGVRHGMIGAPWYGDTEVMARWWPVALELWNDALDARAAPPDARSGTPRIERGNARFDRVARITGRGVEQRQLVGLITRRSAVRIRPPQPKNAT